MPNTASFLESAVALADAALEQALPSADTAPATLHQAMRYAVFAGGKRIRPALVLAACRACGGSDAACAPAMAAVEMLHTYTLVHDDLPAMDDDDLRRGRPTCHVVYGDATAVLVGDALQTQCFETLAAAGGPAVACLARAAGSRGVIGGQQDDLEAEGSTVDDSPACKARLERIHRGKTAALIRASCELGALAAEASPETVATLGRFGEAAGLAFQVIDDILDTTASVEDLGKTPGKDAACGKLTYVAVYGLEAARAEADRLRDEAVAIAQSFGAGGADLQSLAGFIVDRGY
ncbi:MAG: polyprenyl synthetase family protein [Planctomycetota bacterium]|jgi:geranylgeranyl pyrophosphate synthase|nr:polyprenyl synthetase family protein [Planctomycetota bacterium]